MLITSVLIKFLNGLTIRGVDADGGQVGAVQLDNPVILFVLIGDQIWFKYRLSKFTRELKPWFWLKGSEFTRQIPNFFCSASGHTLESGYFAFGKQWQIFE